MDETDIILLRIFFKLCLCLLLSWLCYNLFKMTKADPFERQVLIIIDVEYDNGSDKLNHSTGTIY